MPLTINFAEGDEYPKEIEPLIDTGFIFVFFNISLILANESSKLFSLSNVNNIYSLR